MDANLTIEEVATLARCEHRTVRRAIKAGELEATMIGGKWLISEGAVEAWFALNRVARPPQPRATSRLRQINGGGTG